MHRTLSGLMHINNWVSILVDSHYLLVTDNIVQEVLRCFSVYLTVSTLRKCCTFVLLMEVYMPTDINFGIFFPWARVDVLQQGTPWR